MKRSDKKPLLRKRNLVIILSVIVILLFYVLMIQTGRISNPVTEISKETIEINSTDRCSLIAGKLIHTINNEGECENICFSECEVREGELKDFKFEEKENNCNRCSCYCK